MGYTLEKLEEIVPDLIKENRINECTKEYPILHSIIIALGDEKDEKLYPRYDTLIKTIFNTGVADFNIKDKYGKTLLMASVSAINSKTFTTMLINLGCDPNLPDQYQRIALEYSVLRGHYKNVSILLNYTKMTEGIKYLLENHFENNINKERNKAINILTEPQIIYNKSHFSINEHAKSYWIRIIHQPETEINILFKRSKYNKKDLAGIRHEKNSSDPNYTKYSPSTFVVENIPIDLYFNNNETGVILKHLNYNIPYWHDGFGGIPSNEMCFNKGCSLSLGLREEYQEVNENSIKLHILKKYSEEVYTIIREFSNRNDKNNALLNKELKEINFRYNEGLFRYQKEDIAGIYVNLESKESIKNALMFQSLLSNKFNMKEMQLVYYNSNNGTFSRHDRENLMEIQEMMDKEEKAHMDKRNSLLEKSDLLTDKVSSKNEKYFSRTK